MAFDFRRTYLCFDNKDLIRDGFIPKIKQKGYIPVSTFPVTRLTNPPKGVTYIIGRDETTQEIISVIERKKLLPAEKIKIEFDFSKVMKNAISHPISPGTLFPGTVGTVLGNLGLSAIGFGGITSGLTEMTYHILESKTKINQKIKITQEILDTSIIQFDGFPLSIFGIVKEHIEQFKNIELANSYKEEHPQANIETDSSGNIFARIGLDFSNDQLTKLGKFSEGVFRLTGRKRIDGATDANGLFGGAANTYLRIVENLGDSGEGMEREVVLLGEQNQLFIKIVDDDRTLKFRGDNREALGGGKYPFQISGTTGIDVTDKQIRIDTTGFSVDDIIYITHNTTVGERHLRQNVEHKGTIVQGNTIGIAGFKGSIASEQDIFDYRIMKWKVPSLPDGISMYNIDKITDSYIQDDDYKLTLDEFIEIDTKQITDSDFILTGKEASEIEGWRLSEAILWREIDGFFAADYRGILYISKGGLNVNVLYPRLEIRDQEWFTSYLQNLDFTFPTGPVDPNDPIDEFGSPKFTYLPSDLEKTIESKVDFRNMQGFLFDIAEIVNSLFFDREKTHYYRPFANALKSVSKYVVDDETTGIGLPHLDLLSLICSSVSTFSSKEIINKETITRKTYSYTNFDISSCDNINLEYYDLSHAFFDHVISTFSKARSCEEEFNPISSNYSSFSYDAVKEGPGIYYDFDLIDNEIMEWRPDGGIIESYWKLETPFFCGDFNSDSRVYIEKMGGNSLDNYSWIFVDTEPFVPDNISVDSNNILDSSIVVFSDNNMHDGLCYYKMNDNIFESQSTLIKIDKTKNHNRETYSHVVNGQNIIEAFDHNKNLITGQNRLLGDVPSYVYGIPITEEIFRICDTLCDPDSEESFTFWWTANLLEDLLPDGSSFGLNFSDSPPRVNIPINWYVRYVEIEFSYTEEVVEHIEKYISFYFERTDSSVSNFFVTELIRRENSITMRFNLKYYFGGPFQLLGNFWGKVNIHSIKARFAKGNDASIDPVFNVDTYKIQSGQSAVSYDWQGRIFVFYSNNTTGNIDIATSYNDGDIWAYDRNIIRLISGETATLPFVIKDTTTTAIHLFYVLNDKFLMYKRINTDLIDPNNGLIENNVPRSHKAGDYDLNSDDPEKAYWGDYDSNGVRLRREPSYFVIGSGEDEYFLEQLKINQEIESFNFGIADTTDTNKLQTERFVFDGDVKKMKDMRDNFNGSPYFVQLSDEGVFRVFFVSSSRLSVKSSQDYTSWKYDVFEQSIHKNYMDEELNKGFTEDISNIQVVRNDFDKSMISVLYFHNGMLFIRHFYTDLLYSWEDSEGNLQDQEMIRHLEITDVDTTVNPPKTRTKNLPIFLVGVIPDRIKTTIKSDIDNEIPISESDLAIYFPYKDPDNPSDKDANKAMVNIFNENFKLDTNTQPYAGVSSTGLIRIFYKDSLGNIDGIIIDSLVKPNLEVMNVFNGV